MSAFLVPQSVLNSILSAILIDGIVRDDANPLAELGYDLTNAKGLQVLGTDLWEMNHLALNQRYGDPEKPKTPFKLKVSPNLKEKAQIYKSICCLRYQCSEGNVPDLALYKALSPFAARLAETIVRSSPAYENAPWGD